MPGIEDATLPGARGCVLHDVCKIGADIIDRFRTTAAPRTNATSPDNTFPGTWLLCRIVVAGAGDERHSYGDQYEVSEPHDRRM